MSSQAGSGTRVVSSLYGADSYNPYSIHEQLGDENKNWQLGTPNPQPESPKASHWQYRIPLYRSISWILGFREKYSLLNCFIWGGALVGFCLARSVTMNPHPARIASLLVPGEWFWFQRPLYKYNLFIHIYLTTLGGLGAPLQFLPAMRRRYVILHRLNGYGVLFCLIVGNICGSIIARRSFGGELNVQSAYYILGIMVVFSGLVGIYNVKKDTRRHRKWMLRMVVYFAAVISARLIMLASGKVVTDLGSYFSVWRCDEVLNLLTDPAARQSTYPQCVADGADPSSIWVTVHADVNNGPLYTAAAYRAVNGMALWIATLIHIVAVEFYINVTEKSNQVRLGYVLEPLGYVEDS